MPNIFSDQDRDRLNKVFNDLYYGNGKSGLTTRTQELETCQESQGDRMDVMERRLDGRINGIDKKFWAIILLLLTLLAGVIVDVVRGREQQNPSHSQVY